MNTSTLLNGYDLKNLTVGVLGGHSALDVCHGAKKSGFNTVCVARKGRERTYAEYYRTQNPKSETCLPVGKVRNPKKMRNKKK